MNETELYEKPMSESLKLSLERDGFFVTKCEPFFYTVSRVKIAKVDVKYFSPHIIKKKKAKK